MAYDDVITRNDDGDLAVRTVSVTEGANASSYDDVFTRDTDGKLAVRVVGNGGDSHNLGWYATPEALTTAYPTATAGDWAIVGSTDTVWLWDTDNSQWVDSDTKGQVTSVNGQTGAVTVQETLVNQTNIKSVDGNSLLGSGNLELSTYLTFPTGWTTTGTTKALCDDIAADTTAVKGKAYLGEVTCSDLPTGVLNAEVVVEIMDGTTAQDKIIVLSLKSGNVSPYAWQYVYWDNGTNVSGWKTWQEPLVSGTNIKTINNTSILGSGNITTEVIQVSTMPTASATELDKIYQYIGTTDANYTNGYFYKCVSDGQTPATYSWENIEVQEVDALPSQTGQNGKFLTTDGTAASWSDKPLVNTATGTDAIAIIGTGQGNKSVCIGPRTSTTGFGAVAIGNQVSATGYGGIAIGQTCQASASNSIAILQGNVTSNANNAMMFGIGTNSDANTVKFGNANGNYEIMSADGTIPADRLVHAINKYSTMPTAASTNEGWIVQFTGTTDSTYTHGHLYECVSDGADPATYSWTEVQLGGGGSSYTAGTGIDITSGVISVTSPTLQNTATSLADLTLLGTPASSMGAINIGSSSVASSAQTVAIGSDAKARETLATAIGGYGAEATAQWALALGSSAQATAQGAVQINGGTNNEANTIKFGAYVNNNWENYKLLDSDGTIPTDRFTTTPVVDGTYVPTLTISSGVATKAWSAPSGIADYTSNCIKEIPQDINLELSSGTLTLKAGSKVYVPNGSGVFNTLTIANDISVSSWGGGMTDTMLFVKNGTGFTGEQVDYVYSGSSQPTPGNSSAVWYDTTNNLIKHTNDTGATWTTESDSLPICIISRSSGTITSIKQVFNGFGYIGSTVFALPGVKGLIPNGRNADGTLKSTAITISDVLTTTDSSGATGGLEYYLTSTSINRANFGTYFYDTESNNIVDSSGVRQNTILIDASAYRDSGKVSSFIPKYAFHAVDYNDTDFISNCAMPSDRYIGLTLGTSPFNVTAPADGYIVLAKNATAAGQELRLKNQNNLLEVHCAAGKNNQDLAVTIPCSKGQVVRVYYSADGTTGTFRFVYANGVK